MIRSPKAHNKLGFFNGYFVNDSSDETISSKWERANIVCSWILGSMPKSIYFGHSYSESVVDFWNELCETYNKVDGSIVFNIHQHINSLSQDGSPRSEYFNKIESLWKEFDGLTNISEYTCEDATKFNDHPKLMKLM